MKRLLRYLLPTVVLGIGAGQLIQPESANPPVASERSVWNDLRLDPRVAKILHRSCADCHSYETVWPWYSKISPLSWFVSRHVVKGREKLNFSEWSVPSSDELEEIYDSVAKRKMPLASYTLLHPAARLSEADRQLLAAWIDGKLGPTSR
jgi:hypothetical protein